MASHTGCGSVLELIVHVASRAIERGMHSGQGEPGEFQVIELHAKPVVESVALFATG